MFELARRTSRPRIRGVGAGHKFTLSVKDRLLMPLFHRAYATQTVIVMAFNVRQATVSRDIVFLEPSVRECVPIPEKMYAVVNMVKTVDGLEDIILGLTVLIGVSGQQIKAIRNRVIIPKAAKSLRLNCNYGSSLLCHNTRLFFYLFQVSQTVCAAWRFNTCIPYKVAGGSDTR